MLEVEKKAAQNKTSQKGVGATDTSKNLIVIFASPLHNSWLCESQNMMTSSAGLIHTHLEWATLCLPATRLFFWLCDGKTLRSARSFKLKQEKKPCFLKALSVLPLTKDPYFHTQHTHKKRQQRIQPNMLIDLPDVLAQGAPGKDWQPTKKRKKKLLWLIHIV